MEAAKEYLRYEPETGDFYWIKSPPKHNLAGKKAGYIESDGYVSLRLNGKRYKAHRVAWYLAYGEEPPGLLDHINRNRSDNRITNLRLSSPRLNQQNRSVYKRSVSGKTGVRHYKGRWRASICVNQKHKWLGSFDDLEMAIAARVAAERELFQIQGSI